MRPASYRAAAEKLRRFARQLDERADAATAESTPRDRASLTSAINRLSYFARALSDRHHGRVRGSAE